VNPRLGTIATYPQVRLDAAKAKARNAGRTIYDFGTGDPLEPTPAFVRDALVSALSPVSQYPSSFGSDSLRSAVAAYAKRVLGVSLHPQKEILVSAGSKEAIFHFPLALLDAGGTRRGVLFGDPGYPVYASGAILAGGEAIPIRLRRETNFLLDLESIPQDALSRSRILWLSYPNNPTGAIAPRAYLEEVVRFGRAHDLVVCADECYVELAGPGRATSILEIEREGVLAFHSLSKRSGMTGYRSGFVAGDRALVAAYRKLRPLTGTGSPDFVQAAAIAAWGDDAHVAERRKTFEEKRSLLRAFFDRRGLRSFGDGAIYLWVETPEGLTAEVWAERLAQAGIVVAPGTYFGAGEGFVRVALVPTIADCRAAIEIWEGCF
jgi:succinyldiaminopimelate transaminase